MTNHNNMFDFGKANVVIDPRFRYHYASWYLLGIKQLFGNRISFDLSPFNEIPGDHSSPNGIALILRSEHAEHHIYIDYWDYDYLDEGYYHWADVYAKVNPSLNLLSQYPKVLPSGPMFGLKLHSMPVALVLCLKMYLQGRCFRASFRQYLSDYLYTVIRRRKLQAYEKHVPVKDNYVFHASTLWYNNFAMTDTNYWRGEFLKAAKEEGLTVDGGLFYIGETPQVLKEMPTYPEYKEKYKEFIIQRRITPDEYIRKTKESVLVFNTPSVCECHGWKLGEYLCMGKAIISTPLKRELPAPLVNGEHIVFVNDLTELHAAIRKINGDAGFRKHLEEGARRYYEQWLAPEQMMRRICKQAL